MASTGRFGSPTTHKRLNFAESNAKVNVELRQQQLQLQKEIMRLEKQTKTATTNIANYQQSLKNTYRKLEQRRKEAQAQDRERKFSDGSGKSRKGLMFSTSIKLGLESEDQDDDDATSSSLSKLDDYRTEEVEPANSRPKSRPSLNATKAGPAGETCSFASKTLQLDAKNSPYVSSPFSMRRGSFPLEDNALPQLRSQSLLVNEKGVASPLARSKHSRRSSRPPAKQQGAEIQLSVPATTQAQSMVNLEAKVQHIPLGSKSAAHVTQSGASGAKSKSNAAIKLPPISVPESRSVVDIPSSSFDKKTLLEAAQAMNFKAGNKSHGPRAFGKFYDPVLAPSIVVVTPGTKERASAPDNETDSLALEQMTEDERQKASNKEVRATLCSLFIAKSIVMMIHQCDMLHKKKVELF